MLPLRGAEISLHSLDFEAYLAGGAGEDARGGLGILGVEVGHLDVHHFHELCLGDLADLFLVRLTGSGRETCDLLEQVACGGLLGDEGEGLVLVYRDHDRKHIAGLALGGRIELLAEAHDVDTRLTEGRADRWGWIGGSSLDLEFDDFDDLKQKLVELLGLKLYDHLYITECGGVINGLCIGYVERIKSPEELAQGHFTDAP